MIDNTTIELRHLFHVYSGSTPESGKGLYWDGEIRWITPEDVSKIEHGHRLTDTRRKITQEGYDNSGVKIVPADSIVLTKRAPIGNLAILAIEACCNQGCFLLVSKKDIVPEFFFYYLLANKATLQTLGRGSTFMELSTDDLKSFKVPNLEKMHQLKIAKYLDIETSRIDELIFEKQEQISLLSEKRQAIITHAVTKGLNPDAEMKDSGIEWLGEVPKHWEVERTKWLFRERNERSETGEEELLTVSHLTGVTLRSEKEVNMFEAETTEGYKKCYRGDLIINTLWAWMGAMGITANDGIVSPAYHVYSSNGKILPDFVDLIVRLPLFASEVTRYSKGVWSSRLRLYPDGFYEVYLPVPPDKEQFEIINFIREERNKIKNLANSTERSIELLKERRSALITNAVTGQLKISMEI